MRRLALLLLSIAPGAVMAGERGVLVVNGADETLRQIHVSPAGSSGAGPNRLRSTLPPGAHAQIGYSTGCRADILLTFQSGRSEAFADQDVCTGLRVVAGSGAASGPITTAPVAAATAGPATATSPRPGAPSRRNRSKGPATPVFKPTPVDVPWTGRSITHHFGGLD